MLIILFGVSYVGKSVLIQQLRSRFGWLSIPTYMTRPLRFGETEKISVSQEDFLEMEDKNHFVCVNHIFGNKYGTPKREIELAVQNEELFWMLDFPISRNSLLSDYRYLGFVILPQNEEQLIEQAKSSDRSDRLGSVLEEYRNCYAKYQNQAQIDSGYISVVNLPNKLDETSALIHSLAIKFSV